MNINQAVKILLKDGWEIEMSMSAGEMVPFIGFEALGRKRITNMAADYRIIAYAGLPDNDTRMQYYN